MIYNPVNDMLYLKERMDEQEEKIDKLEIAVRNCLDALYIVIGNENECNSEVKK